MMLDSDYDEDAASLPGTMAVLMHAPVDSPMEGIPKAVAPSANMGADEVDIGAAAPAVADPAVRDAASAAGRGCVCGGRGNGCAGFGHGTGHRGGPE